MILILRFIVDAMYDLILILRFIVGAMYDCQKKLQSGDHIGMGAYIDYSVKHWFYFLLIGVPR